MTDALKVDSVIREKEIPLLLGGNVTSIQILLKPLTWIYTSDAKYISNEG